MMRWALAIGVASVVGGALGAIAAGTVAIRRLAVGPTRIERLELDELIVRKLTVLESDRPAGDGVLLAPARAAVTPAADPWWRS
jgi:hypothetical protein